MVIVWFRRYEEVKEGIMSIEMKVCDDTKHGRYKVTWVDPQQGVILPCALCENLKETEAAGVIIKEMDRENRKLKFYLTKEYKITLAIAKLFAKFG